MNPETECPECGKEMTLQGTHGHIRMAHNLSGRELEEAWQEAKRNAYYPNQDASKRRREAKQRQRPEREPRTRERSASERIEVPAVPAEKEEETDDSRERETSLAPVPETTRSDGSEEQRSEPGPLAEVPEPEHEVQEPEAREVRDSETEVQDAEIIEEARKEADHSKQVNEALERYRRARHRLAVVKEDTGEEVEREIPKDPPGIVAKGICKAFGMTKTETVTERTDAEAELVERCRKEVEEAEAELRRALDHRQVEHDHAEDRS